MRGAERPSSVSAVSRPTITALTEAHLDDAAALLAARHGRQRALEPLLATRFEKQAPARAEVAALWEHEGASGTVAVVAGRVTGFLLGSPRDGGIWGPSMWVEPAGHAVERAETVRDLYAVAAAHWVEDGRTFHYAVVPASDATLVDAWFRLGFGQQHVHALREAPETTAFELPAGLEIRRAGRPDIEPLAELDLVLLRHQAVAPVYSAIELPTLDEARAEWSESIDDPSLAAFVAVSEGQVLGSAIACSVQRSSAHTGVARPDNAGHLGFAAVFPEARGRGAGRALGNAVMAWSAEQGYRTVVTDWRATNLLSSRCWPRLGFRPTFHRLFRAIV
jgi:ribosomal protein S18 acetylase RimI-like enzyme